MNNKPYTSLKPIRRRDQVRAQRTLKKPAAKKNASQKTPKKKVARPVQTSVKLSDCLMRYAQAQLNPWGNLSEMPCIPDVICTPSHKFSAFIKTVCTVGSNGTAYVLVDPWRFWSDAGPTQITQALITTTGAYPDAGAVNYSYALPSGNLSSANFNSPYTYASIQNGRFRLVACGVQLQYTGQILSQAGVVTTLQTDGCANLDTGTAYDAIKNNARAVTCPVSQTGVCHVNYYPTDEALLSYEPPFLYGQNQKFVLVMIVTGATPGTTFQVQCKAFWELQNSGFSTTPSHSDPVGLGAYHAARTQVTPTNDVGKDLQKTLKYTISEVLKNVTRVALTPAAMAVGGALGGPPVAAAFGGAAQALSDLITS